MSQLDLGKEKKHFAKKFQEKINKNFTDIEQLLKVNAHRMREYTSDDSQKVIQILNEFEKLANPGFLNRNIKGVRYVFMNNLGIIFTKFGMGEDKTLKFDLSERTIISQNEDRISMKGNYLFYMYPVLNHETKNKSGIFILTIEKSTILSSFLPEPPQIINYAYKPIVFWNLEKKDSYCISIPNSKYTLTLFFEKKPFIQFISENILDLLIRITMFLIVFLLFICLIKKERNFFKKKYEEDFHSVLEVNHEYLREIENLKNLLDQNQHHLSYIKNSFDEKEKIFDQICARYQRTLTNFSEDFYLIYKFWLEGANSSFEETKFLALCEILLQSGNHPAGLIFETTNLETVNLVELIDSSLKILARKILQDEINIQKDNFKTPYTLEGDKLILWIIIYNIIRTSLNRSLKSGTVTFIISDYEELIEFSVVDTGYSFDDIAITSLTKNSLGKNPFSLDFKMIDQMAESCGANINTVLSSKEGNTTKLSLPKKKISQKSSPAQGNVIKLFKK